MVNVFRRISLSRPITSYSKVEKMIGKLLRNRTLQLRRARIRGLRLVNLGCGRTCDPRFINIDYLWHSQIDLCWDLRTGIPLASASVDGIFTEHCLEHFPMDAAFGLLKECRRILRPKGVLRVIVPDGAIYLDTYYKKTNGDTSAEFPYPDHTFFADMRAPILHVNRIFYDSRHSPAGHHVIYDFALLSEVLGLCGFSSVTRTSFGRGHNADLCIDTPWRSVESLYVDAA